MKHTWVITNTWNTWRQTLWWPEMKGTVYKKCCNFYISRTEVYENYFKFKSEISTLIWMFDLEFYTEEQRRNSKKEVTRSQTLWRALYIRGLPFSSTCYHNIVKLDPLCHLTQSGWCFSCAWLIQSDNPGPVWEYMKWEWKKKGINVAIDDESHSEINKTLYS